MIELCSDAHLLDKPKHLYMLLKKVQRRFFVEVILNEIVLKLGHYSSQNLLQLIFVIYIYLLFVLIY